MIDKLNKNITGILQSDEYHTDVGSSPFKLNHDTILENSNLEIWTNSGQSGTQLTKGTDFVLDTKLTELSNEAANDVYQKIDVINSTYQSVALFFTYDTVGDFIEAED